MPSGGGNTRTVSTQEMSPEQQRLLRLVMPNVRDYIRTPLEQFPGSTVAGFTPTQTAARDRLADTAVNTVDPLSRQSISTASNLSGTGTAQGTAGTSNLLQAGQQGTQGVGEILGNFGRTQGSRDFLASGALLDPSTNPVLAAQSRGAIAPIAERLTENVLPGIRGDFVGNNMFGSSRQGIAEGRAINDFIREAGNITTNLQANNFNQGLGAMLGVTNNAADNATSATGQALGAGEAGTSSALNSALQALGLSPSLAQLAFLPGATMEGIGESERQLDQARLSEEAQRFTTGQMLPFLQAQDVANLAFGMGGGTATTNAQQNAAFDPLSTILGLGTLASALPSLLSLSDERMKEDIKRVGTTDDGIPIYTYRMKGSIRTEMGVLAHEVEKIKPEAVRTLPTNEQYKLVNYAMIS